MPSSGIYYDDILWCCWDDDDELVYVKFSTHIRFAWELGPKLTHYEWWPIPSNEKYRWHTRICQFHRIEPCISIINAWNWYSDVKIIATFSNNVPQIGSLWLKRLAWPYCMIIVIDITMTMIQVGTAFNEILSVLWIWIKLLTGYVTRQRRYLLCDWD